MGRGGPYPIPGITRGLFATMTGRVLLFMPFKGAEANHDRANQRSNNQSIIATQAKDRELLAITNI